LDAQENRFLKQFGFFYIEVAGKKETYKGKMEQFIRHFHVKGYPIHCFCLYLKGKISSHFGNL